MNNENYLDFIAEQSYKNLVKNKENTSPNLAWYEEEKHFEKAIPIESLWVDVKFIPYQAPKFTNSNIYSIENNGVTINVLEKKTVQLETKDNILYSPELLDSIDHNYGKGYDVILKDANDEQVPFGLNRWIVDSSSGNISFLDGLPEGFTEPFNVTFIKYIGRKGTQGLLKTDGTVEMDNNYYPEQEQDVVTKRYVDENITNVADIVDLLVPTEPDTMPFGIKLLSETREGKYYKGTSDFIDVVYNFDTLIIETKQVMLKKDFDVEFSININNSPIQPVTLKRDVINSFTQKYENQGITYQVDIRDPYGENVVSNGFYKCADITTTIDLNKITNNVFLKIFAQVENRFKEYYHSTDPIVLGSCNKVLEGRQNTILNCSPEYRYISGIKLANKFDYSVSFFGFDNFESRSLGKINFGNIKEVDIEHKDNLSSEEFFESGVIDDKDKFSMPIKAKLELNNLDYENILTYENDFNFIYETISDESDRLKSSTEDIYTPAPYDSEQSLLENNELQLFRGHYRYPREDFSPYGEHNYSACKGKRYVTKAFELENANHFILEFTDLYNSAFVIDKDISIDMYVDKDAVINSDEEIKFKSWININKAFNGTSSCFYIEDAGSIDISKSDRLVKYVTFGPVTITGKIYIRIGLKETSKVVFNF